MQQDDILSGILARLIVLWWSPNSLRKTCWTELLMSRISWCQKSHHLYNGMLWRWKKNESSRRWFTLNAFKKIPSFHLFVYLTDLVYWFTYSKLQLWYFSIICLKFTSNGDISINWVFKSSRFSAKLHRQHPCKKEDNIKKNKNITLNSKIELMLSPFISIFMCARHGLERRFQTFGTKCSRTSSTNTILPRKRFTSRYAQKLAHMKNFSSQSGNRS